MNLGRWNRILKYFDSFERFFFQDFEVVLKHLQLEHLFLWRVNQVQHFLDVEHYLKVEFLLWSWIVLRGGWDLSDDFLAGFLVLDWFLFLLDEVVFLFFEENTVSFVIDWSAFNVWSSIPHLLIKIILRTFLGFRIVSRIVLRRGLITKHPFLTVLVTLLFPLLVL